VRSTRRVVLPLILLVAALSASASAAGARSKSTVTIQGGTTISDSGLMANVIVPGFQKMFPQYKLKFVPVGTAQALTNAELGLGDGVFTHNPSAEAQFVAGGYSYEASGRAIMYSDFVVIGPKTDPAGVGANASANAAAAFQDIANAANSGQADFVSRGDGSGTNAKEAAIWALTTVPLMPPPAGVTSGGVPTVPGSNPPVPPSWYHTTGAGQAANLQETEQCPTSTFSSGACYTLADRGTFNYLQSLGEVPDLKIVSQTNPSPAPGGPGLMNNLYHAYTVNPNAPLLGGGSRGPVNLQGALAFEDYLTSPQFQNAVAHYPTASNPAFHPDAYADIAPSNVFMPTYNYGNSSSGVTVKGNVSSVVPFSAALSGAPVNVVRKTGTTTTPVASGVTDSSGNYSVNFFPDHNGTYEIDFPQFKDLRETFFTLGVLKVVAGVTLQEDTQSGLSVSVEGTADPTSNRNNAKITIQAKQGSGSWTSVGTVALADSQETFSKSVTLPSAGKWKLRARYTDSGVVASANSSAITVHVS
jgi:tungstate transport system substrate-binding protein